MPISYYLRKNHFSDDPYACRAFVSPVRTVELNDVIERMIEMGSTVGDADMLGVFVLFSTVLEAMMSEGTNVNTPFANYRTSIKGIFVDHQDSFDHSRHKIVPSVSAGKRLKHYFLNDISTAKIESVNKGPQLLEFTDHASGETNRNATPGNMATIAGHRLKVNPENKSHGIFFIAKDSTETRVKVIGQNSPSRLRFNIPDSLASGNYSLEVRNDSKGALKSAISVA
jgi:hypothetical protein